MPAHAFRAATRNWTVYSQLATGFTGTADDLIASVHAVTVADNPHD